MKKNKSVETPFQEMARKGEVATLSLFEKTPVWCIVAVAARLVRRLLPVAKRASPPLHKILLHEVEYTHRILDSEIAEADEIEAKSARKELAQEVHVQMPTAPNQDEFDPVKDNPMLIKFLADASLRMLESALSATRGNHGKSNKLAYDCLRSGKTAFQTMNVGFAVAGGNLFGETEKAAKWFESLLRQDIDLVIGLYLHDDKAMRIDHRLFGELWPEGTPTFWLDEQAGT